MKTTCVKCGITVLTYPGDPTTGPLCPECWRKTPAAQILSEADTRRRENLQKPTRDYPGADQMMRWQRDYK